MLWHCLILWLFLPLLQSCWSKELALVVGALSPGMNGKRRLGGNQREGTTEVNAGTDMPAFIQSFSGFMKAGLRCSALGTGPVGPFPGHCAK